MERSLTLSLWALICILNFPFAVEAQNQKRPTTDPAEVRALNSIFQQWGLSSNYQNSWNVSGEPCTGVAIDNSTDIKSEIYNPFIICNCSFDNNSTCHITKLKVLQLNVSGVLPDELWTLTYLTDLAIGTNNFSGPLPDELGNCSKLEMIYIDSSGISGQIPSTFANLRSMLIMYASNTGLTGKIPDFIGNWSNFTTLRLQGNSFEGPIPSTFANLTSMLELRINGLTNGGSLAFIKDMKSLEVLDLRYNNISDVMPSTIGEYQNLTWLDLSFNNITGQIPDSLFNLRSLIYLSLGNNKLNGSLPSEKSASLQNM
ncbi:putative ATP binding protein [Corchorus capsularis]|uniref:Putative ATP binding protein n=1 Tax=Corchorus capsularis TaxID=210143 RepID=A0A1R3KVY2_COCAP|nr:putative ATP binding protein [Corchorus capsularis]